MKSSREYMAKQICSADSNNSVKEHPEIERREEEIEVKNWESAIHSRKYFLSPEMVLVCRSKGLSRRTGNCWRR